FTTPFRLNETPIRTTSWGYGRSNKRLCDLSMSPFTHIPQVSVAKPTLEYTLQASSTGGVTMQNLLGTPNSILSHFRVERYPQAPMTPQSPSLWATADDECQVGTPISFDDEELVFEKKVSTTK